MYKYQVQIEHENEYKRDWITVYIPVSSDQEALQAATTALYNYTHPITSFYDTDQKMLQDNQLKERYSGYHPSHVFKQIGGININDKFKTCNNRKFRKHIM